MLFYRTSLVAASTEATVKGVDISLQFSKKWA